MHSIRDRIYIKAEEASIPLAVHFDLTYRCNLRCIHCYLPERNRHLSAGYREELKRENRHELETHEVLEVLDQLAECGTLFLAFSGGEIFVRDDALDIIEYARKKRFGLSLMTTGTIRFDEKIADRLAEFGMQVVDVSVYSADPEIHDSVTRVPGSFNKTIECVKLLSDRNIKTRIKCPLMKANAQSFRGLVDLANQYEVDFLFDTQLAPRIDGDKRPKLLEMDYQEQEAYYRYTLQMNRNFGDPEIDESSDSTFSAMMDGSPCSASHSSCYISPYGDVLPCLDISIPCGNLREVPFREIWADAEGMILVRSVKRSDLRKCPDCPETGYCHRCIGSAYSEHRDLLAPATAFCKRTKMWNKIEKEIEYA